MTERTCDHPGCDQAALVKVDEGHWLCRRHVTERVNEPHNRALTQASEDLDEFTNGGGKPS